MSKNDKIYRIVSIIGLLLHIFVFLFVIIVGFLPFHENKNFYECFTGYFGENLSIYQPYFIIAIMFISCVPALLAIKYPPISFFTGVCTLSFFVIVVLPYSFEAAFVGLASPWIDAEMSTYGIGFELMGAASYIIYFDMSFFIYSIITILIRAKTNPYMVLMFCVAFILMLILCSCKVNEDPEEIITVNYNVEIVEKLFQIPVEYEVSDILKEKGFLSIEEKEDGLAVYKIKHKDYNEYISQLEASKKEILDRCNTDYYPYVTSVSYNDDLTKIKIAVDKSEYENVSYENESGYLRIQNCINGLRFYLALVH